MGDQPIQNEGVRGDDGQSSRTRVSSDVVASRQDPLATAPVGAERIPFELVVFERSGSDRMDVMVCGMWSGDTPVLECFDAGETMMVSVLGVDDDRRDPKPYRVVAGVDLADATAVEVRGARHSERIVTVDLGELAVVCGADPSMAGLAGAFMHSRGSHLVRVEPMHGHGLGPARRSSITLVA